MAAASSIWALQSKDPSKRYFEDEISKKIRFNKRGLLATAN